MPGKKSVLTGRGGGQTIKNRISTFVNACANDIIKSLNIPFDKAVSDKVVELLQCRDESGALNCAYCLKMPAVTEDHFLPLIRNKKPTGATNHAINMIPCCKSCNSSKNGKLFEDWRPLLAAEPRFIAYLTYRKTYMEVNATMFAYEEEVFLTLVESHVKQMMEFRERLLLECKPCLVQTGTFKHEPIPEEELSDIDAP
jgi:hypothetical protein